MIIRRFWLSRVYVYGKSKVSILVLVEIPFILDDGDTEFSVFVLSQFRKHIYAHSLNTEVSGVPDQLGMVILFVIPGNRTYLCAQPEYRGFREYRI